MSTPLIECSVIDGSVYDVFVPVSRPSREKVCYFLFLVLVRLKKTSHDGMLYRVSSDRCNGI